MTGRDGEYFNNPGILMTDFGPHFRLSRMERWADFRITKKNYLDFRDHVRGDQWSMPFSKGNRINGNDINWTQWKKWNF
jgi:hypothetical protein